MPATTPTSPSLHFAIGPCSLGAILVAWSDQGVCAILLGDDAEAVRRELEARFPGGSVSEERPDGTRLLAQVTRFVENPAAALDLPRLDVRGTVFQQRVWGAIREIPAGSTASYAEIAERIGAPGAVRAVAQACGANRLAVAIPCHRVIASDGTLNGYRWGIERKQALLEREGALTPTEAA